MDTHLFPVLFILSISMFTASNSLEFELSVTNGFENENAISLTFAYRNGVKGAPTTANANAKDTVTSRVTFTDHQMVACKCLVTELGNFGTRHYGFFEVSTSRSTTFDVLVNEEGAFLHSESSGKQLLQAWLKQEFYVYNLLNRRVKLAALTGVSTVVKAEEVQPGGYLHWTRIVHERSRNVIYKRRLGEVKEKKIIQVCDTSSLDVDLLKISKSMSYKYAVKETGIGNYNPETSEYDHLSDWPKSTK